MVTHRQQILAQIPQIGGMYKDTYLIGNKMLLKSKPLTKFSQLRIFFILLTKVPFFYYVFISENAFLSFSFRFVSVQNFFETKRNFSVCQLIKKKRSISVKKPLSQPNMVWCKYICKIDFFKKKTRRICCSETCSGENGIRKKLT